MKTIKPLSLGLLTRPWRQQGGHRLAIAALGFFRLGEASQRFLPEAEQWPLLLKALPPGKPLDEIHPKPHGELLLAGSAYAPAGEPVSSLIASMRLGEVEKLLRVWGDRRWYYGPWYRISEPQPFTCMPLLAEKAFGGPKHADNPVGTGYTGNRLAGWIGTNEGAMPNIELAQVPVDSHVRKMAPALLGPLEQTLPARAQWVGSYDEQWLLEDAPGLARDLDARFFQVAPADQWNDGPWRGDEHYCLDNLHPSQPRIEGQLPGFAARAFVREKASGDIREVAMSLDTIWLLPEAMLGVCIYHSSTPVSDPDGLDVDAIMVGYEALAACKAHTHYAEVMQLRSDEATAVLHAMNEAQLAPALPAEVQAARAIAATQRQAERQEKQQARLDAHMADIWQQIGTKPPADYVPPRIKASPMDIDYPSLHEGEVDLGAWLSGVTAMAQQARQDGEAKLAEAAEKVAGMPPGPPLDAAETRERHYRRAAQPAWDLVGGDDANVAQLEHALQLAAEAGKPLSSEERAKLIADLGQLPALQRQAKRLLPAPAEPPLDDDLAQWLGEQIRLWRQGGVALAGRDLRGANLAGMDFRGADLRQVCFESANLRGANLAQADLRGASLVGSHLEQADLSGAVLDEAGMAACHAAGANLAGASLRKVLAPKADFHGADFTGAVLEDVQLNEALLQGCKLTKAVIARTLLTDIRAGGSDWQGASLMQCLLLKADLRETDFREARLEKTVLLNARLDGSDWRKAVVLRCAAMGASARGVRGDGLYSSGSGWRGINWQDASLRKVRLIDCDLAAGSFQRACLVDSLLARCLLQDADLADCELRGANLLQSICRKASFRGADLRRASLRQATLDDADFTDARLDNTDFDPASWRRVQHRLKATAAQREAV